MISSDEIRDIAAAVRLQPTVVEKDYAIGWLLAGSSLAHILMVTGEVTVAHPTAHARLAIHELTQGACADVFRIGFAMSAIGLLAPWMGIVAVPFALGGLLAHEHAYVRAAQLVPLA